MLNLWNILRGRSFLMLLAMMLLVLILAVAVWAATSLSAKTEIKINSRFVDSLDLSSPVDQVALSDLMSFTAGTGDKQITVLFHDTRSLGDAATESLDLAGSLTNAFGSTVTFTKIKAIFIKNTSTTQTFSVGGGGVNSFINWVADASDIIKVPPEGVLVLTAPNAGFAVTAGTGDLLKVLNSAGAAASYKIWIIGN